MVWLYLHTVYVYMYIFICFAETKSRNTEKAMEPKWSECCHETLFHISKGHLATKTDCEQCKTAEDPALRERTVQNIRGFVRNRGLMLKKKVLREFLERSFWPYINVCGFCSAKLSKMLLDHWIYKQKSLNQVYILCWRHPFIYFC